MSFINWVIHPDAVFSASPVIPVLTIHKLEHAQSLANILFAEGINILEITLRTPIALDALRLFLDLFPEKLIGLGTITTPKQLEQAQNAGAKFVISPGQTHDLLEAGRNLDIPFIPGISSASELMNGLNSGYTHFKFFPAVAAGGITMLQSLYAPFPQAKFCPTGGINKNNVNDFLALPNVSCVGGSWMVPAFEE